MKISLCAFLLALLAVISASSPLQIRDDVVNLYNTLSQASKNFDHTVAILSKTSDPNIQDPASPDQTKAMLSDTLREGAGYIQDILTAIHALAESDVRFASLVPRQDSGDSDALRESCEGLPSVCETVNSLTNSPGLVGLLLKTLFGLVDG